MSARPSGCRPLGGQRASGQLLLAPMEGLLDAALRDVLTQVGGVHACVSEFIRVTGTLLPKRAFIRVIPELLNGGRTLAGVPVIGQLLGSDVNCLAENAAQLAALGPAGIDLNFGCPAKLVNRHGGGALLLTNPALIGDIVSAVRRAVPASLPVSAKMRLGYEDDALAEDCARAIAAGGASRIVVHARTKRDGYRPPAYWGRIADIRAAVSIPLVANGEIWTADDAQRCQTITGCRDLMIGRGMVADPGLAWAIRARSEPVNTRLTWQTLLPLLQRFWALVSTRVEAKHRAGRLKQWLNSLRRRFVQAEALYQSLRTINDARTIEQRLRQLEIDHGPEGNDSDKRAHEFGHQLLAAAPGLEYRTHDRGRAFLAALNRRPLGQLPA